MKTKKKQMLKCACGDSADSIHLLPYFGSITHLEATCSTPACSQKERFDMRYWFYVVDWTIDDNLREHFLEKSWGHNVIYDIDQFIAGNHDNGTHIRTLVNPFLAGIHDN